MKNSKLTIGTYIRIFGIGCGLSAAHGIIREIFGYKPRRKRK